MPYEFLLSHMHHRNSSYKSSYTKYIVSPASALSMHCANWISCPLSNRPDN